MKDNRATSQLMKFGLSLVGLCLCCSLVILAPALTHAANLETPSNGDNLSGIGVIRGWKCEAIGDITVRFDEENPVSLVYGSERGDTSGACGDANNGFVAIYNWSLLSTGEHTAVAYDNGVEFARSTFTVVRPSEEETYLEDRTAECTVPNFPDPGTNASFEWNQGTQHLELAEVGEDVVVPVSTQFDGEWDFTLVLDSELSNLCDCYRQPLEGSFNVEDGNAFTDWVECVSEIRMAYYGVVSPSGQLESSFGPRNAEGNFLPYGSLDGFLSDDGTGEGRWMVIYGCGGHWSAERREDS